MTANKWFSLYVVGSVAVMWMIYSMVHDVKADQVLLEYQLTKIHEKLDWHTEKLEIIQGSQYEILKQLDIIKGE